MAETESTGDKRALELRRRAKSRKPEFARPESWKYFRLKENWRRPKGLDNKVRKRIKGWPPRVSAGYMGPKATRGLHPSGYEEILVYNVEDLERIDSKTQAVRMGHRVGRRKRFRIMAEARKKKIVVLNAKETKEPEKGKELAATETEEQSEKEKTAEAAKTKTREKEEQKEKRKKRTDKS